MTTRDRFIHQTLNQREFRNWPSDAKSDLRDLLGSLYDKYGLVGVLHHQSDLLDGIKEIMNKHNMKEQT